MLIRELRPGEEDDWTAYITAHPSSTCYHALAWKAVAEKAYRMRTRFLLARSRAGGEVTGALPLFQINGLVRAHLSNGLFGAYASPLADDELVRRALIQQARHLAETEDLACLVLKTLEDTPPESFSGFQRQDGWQIATLPLQPDPAVIWNSLRDKIRNCVRKAQKHGLEARSGADQLEAFYRVLAENMHCKGSPIYGTRFMRVLLEASGRDAEILTLWKDRKPVAGAFLLAHRGTISVPFASSLPSALAMSPNNLLYWEIIRRGCEAGRTLLDFGRSLKDSGPLAFKLGWGAQTQEQPRYVYTTGEPAPQMNEKPRAVTWFVERWKQLPRPMADSLGPAVCRQVAGLL